MDAFDSTLILRAAALEFRDYAPSDGFKRVVDGLLLCGSLVGFAVLVPVTLMYNTYGFSVFSGKVRVDRD
jgi:cytochrome bd-type quinol oxidase subunit 2